MTSSVALVVLAIVLSQTVDHRTHAEAGGAQRDPAEPPCEVDRTRAAADATRTNPYDCPPLSLSTHIGQIPRVGDRHGYVSVTTLAAPRTARRAYQRASRELARKEPNYAKAAKELEKAVKLDRDFAAAWYLLGSVHLTLHQNAYARDAFQQALAADPKYPHPYLPLALMELEQGRFSEAATLADQVLMFDPLLMEAHFYSAVAHYNLGEIPAAKRSISAIIESGDDKLFPRVHAMLGEILANEGNLGASAREYRRLLELDPNSRVAEAAKKQLAEWQAKGLIGKP